MRTNRTVAERVFAAFLSLVLVLGMFPVRTSAEETAAVYGNVVAATQGVTVSGNGTAEIAATNGNMTLNWIAANAEAGRNQDGWWVGLNLYAPAGMTAEQLKTVKYGYTADNLNLNFWEKKDSKDADQNHYIGLWGITNETYLKENKVTYDWYISWDGKSVQHIQLKLDPSKVVLKDAQGNGVYPVYGNVDAYTQGLTITGSGSEAVVVSNGNITLDWVAADESIGRVQDGWWVGVKVNAPAGLTEEQLKNAAYGRTPDALTGSFWNDKNSAPNAQLHYIDLWILVNETKLEQNKLNYDFYFCWDGTNVQKVQLKMDPTKVMLKDAQGKGVYPVYGTVAPISQGITVTSNGTEEVALTNSDITLQWVKADPSIGRNQDGWWIGLKVNAPAGMTAEQLQNSTYGYTAESMTKSFWSNKDSADTAQSHHIQVWCMTNETYLKEGKVTYNWYFNWDGKNVQHIQLKLDPAKVKLEESKTVGYGTVVAITPADAVISGGDSAITVAVEKAELTWVEADEKLGREAGWWVGIKAIAPEGFSENAQYAYVTDGVIGAGKPFATYKDGPNHIELWFKVTDTALVADADRKLTMNYAFDWNGNGIYEQTVQFYVNADGDILLKNAAGQQVYPYFLGSVDATEISTSTVVGNETKTVTVDLGGHEIVWNNGWKVSVKASLDGQEKTITANFDSVDVTAADYTEEIDWNGDGLVDQTVKITGSVKLLKAEQEAPLFENGSAVTVSSYDLYEGYTNPVTNTGAGALTYSISENDYVSIDENGNVTVKNWNLLRGIKEAQKIATVTVGYEACDTHNASAVSSYDLTVSPKMDSKLTFEKNEVTVNYNDGTYANTLTAGVKDYTVTMVSSEPAIATVDNEGVVTFLQAGTVTITATAEYSKWYTTTSVSYTLTIEKGEQEELKFVKPLDEVVYNPDGYDFNYSVQGGSGTGEVTYKSSAEEVASIDAAGKVTVHKAGEVTFTATKDEDACYLTATVSHTMTIDKANQEIVFATTDPAAITYAYGTVFENAVSNGDGSGKITYSFSCDTANSGSAIDAATGDLSVAAAGTYTVTAVKEEDDCYNGTEAIYTLVVNKAEQEIAFAEISGEHTLKNSEKAYTIEMNATEHCYNDGDVDYLFEIVGEKTATLSDTSVDAKTGVVTIGEGDYGTLTVKVTRPGDNRFLDWESSEFTLTIEQIDADANNFNFEGNKNEGYENGEWYCGPVTVTYEADGVKYQVSTATEKTEKWSDSYTISEDGIYSDVKLSLKSTQEHGGVHYAQDVPTVKIDTHAPSSNISFGKSVWGDVLETMTFGFYQAQVTVVITAEDYNEDAKIDGSGIEKICYRLVDANTQPDEGWIEVLDDEAVFTIDKEFVGQVEYYAVDVAGNDDKADKLEDRVTLIVDNTKPVADVEWSEAVAEIEEIHYYAGNAVATVRIEESNFFDGRTAADSEGKGVLVYDIYDAERVIAFDNAEEAWTQAVDAAGNAIADNWIKTVTFAEDGHYILNVRYEDHSQNEMAPYTSEEIVVDTTAPKFSVEYDNLVRTLNEKSYFKNQADLRIIIDEANFFEKDVKLFVDDQAVEAEWTVSEDGKHVGTFTIDAEGEHELKLQYSDRSANAMTDMAGNALKNEDGDVTDVYMHGEIIVVDKTAPKLSVDQAYNGEYFGDATNPETVTINVTIEEKNFHAEDVVLTVETTAVNETGEKKMPDYAAFAKDAKNWTKAENADIYTLQLVFEVDAQYTVDLEYSDLAAIPFVTGEDNAADLTALAFTLDNTVPESLEIILEPGNVWNNILNTIFFNKGLNVTIKATDLTAGVKTFAYTYTVRDAQNPGVSQVNKGGSGQVEATRVAGTNVYEAKITIPAQFDGYLSFTAMDMAENVSDACFAMNGTEKQILVVDTINPKTTVTYSEAVQTVDGVAYYDDTIVATIRVEDANFRREYIGEFINVEVTRDGKAHPVHITWRDISADVHTGEFVLDKDGDYIVTITGNDPARNDMDEYKSHQLTLDTVLPTVEVTNVVANSANTDEVYTFEITASDINIDSATFKPVLTGIFRDADGKFVTKTIELGDMKEIKKNETYSFTVENLEEDAIYTLTCSVSDLAKNTYEKVMLKDEKEYEEVQFSINRNGSTYMLDDNTTELVGNYYVQNVNDNVVLIEINPDVLEEHSVTLNGRDLADGDDYSVREEGGNGSWMKYTYSVNKDLMADESEYNLVVSSEDKAGNKAFSDVKGASIGFVVDRTAPVVTVTGIHNDGRYQVESQTVTLIPMDPGGALKALSVYLVDDDGNVLQQLIDLSGEDLYNALEENEDQITFEIGEGLYQNVRVVCTDLAVDETGATNAYDETFTNISVSTSGFMIFWANKPLRYGVIFGTLGLAALALFLIFGKKKKV